MAWSDEARRAALEARRLHAKAKVEVRNPFSGGKKATGVTKKHQPLVWENMLGTVYAKNPYTGKAEYFDYKYRDARKHARVAGMTDLRIARAKQRIQVGSMWDGISVRKGQLALWGVPKSRSK